MADRQTYIPFARKYRSSNFTELMGQDVLVKTLSYCIENDRLAQSYLLTGIRGVGKTSSARIIAKTVNCTSRVQKDGYINPCEKCQNCQSFNENKHPDIIEIDAASKTSVDDIREIIESAEYRPLQGEYKFYIIDEIHMLSKSAFNALLKIVEEPPAHIVFIFATTEVQKIPLTVISRCQRYDLRRLTSEEIFKLTASIAQKENIQYEDEALQLIAEKSEGSARDAVSILDQAGSYLHHLDSSGGAGDKITQAVVEKMLGLLDTGTIVKFVKLIIANSPNEAINLLNEIYQKANSLEYFVQGLCDFMAELSKAKLINNYHNPILKTHEQDINNILAGTSADRLSTLWQLFSNEMQNIKYSHNELISCQMLIIKAIHACNIPSLNQIMDAEYKITEYEQLQETEITDGNPEELKNEPKITDIFEFIRHLYKNKEMECYYLMLNDVEIEEFKEQTLALKGNLNAASVNLISKHLNIWSGKEYKISQIKTDKIESLKNIMVKKAQRAEDFNVIKKYFPNANISDIIFRNS